jgi:hypothetical protein
MAENASLLKRMKDALNKLWNWVADTFGIEFTSAEEVADRVLYDLVRGFNPNIGEASSQVHYHKVTNQAEIDRLESEPTIKAYRAMQVINGELYPPMSAVVDGKLREPIALGQWEQSEERPDLADDNGRFKLDKGNKKSLKAAYNPYFHSSSTPLNDQFSEAQDRDNLVTVEVEVPASEADGTSGYKAEKAKDAVGTHQWKAGIIQGQLTGTREVFLTRWDKPIRIVPDSEVAGVIANMLEGCLHTASDHQIGSFARYADRPYDPCGLVDTHWVLHIQ